MMLPAPLPPPPLPDPRELLATSEWAAARPDLKRYAEHWFDVAPPHRAKLAREALRLAEPSLRWSTIGAVARTGGRVVSAVGIDGLAEIFDAASAARRGDGTGKIDMSVAVEHAQRLVEAGGPAYVKLGQFIASAKGLLPDEWVEAFAWCRDEVPALRRGTAEAIIERTFGKPPSELFASFDPDPIAAASIAQVHAATLTDGTAVVVKVRRPGLRRKFLGDISVMALMAAAAERLVPDARMANLSGFVELFAQIVLEELDLRLEAVNIVELALASENAGHDYANYPRPVPDLTAANVLVMERVPGVRYTDAAKTYGASIDGEKLLRLAITSVLEHTMIYGKFHGDLHAGNVFIAPDGTFSLVDFGIIGRLTAEQRAALVRFMIGFAQSNVRLQLEAMRDFGAIGPDADFERLVAEVQVHADKLAEIEIRAGQVSHDLDELAESMGLILRLLARTGFVLPKELVLFFKNLLYLNSFAASLAPDVNLLEEIEPIFTYFMTKYPEALQVITGA